MTHLESQLRAAFLKLNLSHEATWVWDHVCSRSLDATERETLAQEIIARRESGEPLAYILGHVPFLGLDIKVAPGVLIPRPETEELAEKMAELAQKYVVKNSAQEFRVLDLGAGSGALGLGVASALLERFSQLKVYLHAVERSPEAKPTLSNNLNQVSEAYGLRLEVTANYRDWNDLDNDLPGCDLVLGNPPYVSRSEWPINVEKSVKSFEPHTALIPGVPNENQKSLARDFQISESMLETQALGPLLENFLLASRNLKSGGLLGIEIGAAQGELFETHLRETLAAKYHLQVSLQRDLSNKLRFLIGHKHG